MNKFKDDILRIVKPMRIAFRKRFKKQIYLRKKYLYNSSRNIIVNTDFNYNKSVAEIKENDGIIATRENLIPYKKSDTLFIIGSGSSLNTLTPHDWKIIKNHDSIGFNFSILHEHTPTYYHVEYTEEAFPIIKNIYSEKIHCYQSIPYLTFYKHVDKHRPLRDYNFSDNNRFSLPRYIDTQENVKTLERILKTYYFERDFRRENLYLHQRGSLSLMISLGVLLDYKKIILLGIDLNDSNYFFEDQDKFNSQHAKEVRDFVYKGKAYWKKQLKLSNKHLTADNIKYCNSLPMDKFIQVYQNVVLESLGTKLYIANKKSLLYPQLELYEFPDKIDS